MELPQEAVDQFVENVSDLWIPSVQNVPRLVGIPDDFYKEYVSVSRPCILQSALPMDDCSVCLEELVRSHPSLVVTVDITPDGHGDCIRRVKHCSGDTSSCRRCFVTPKEVSMTLESFYERLKLQQEQQGPVPKSQVDARVFDCMSTSLDQSALGENDLPNHSICYYSRQNDCLRTELKVLQHLFPPTLPRAEEAFGTGPPDAINLWMGNECSTSDLHKDYYENLFHVSDGQKVFTLYPPSDAPFMRQLSFPSGSFDCGTGESDNSTPLLAWKVAMNREDETVRWIDSVHEAYTHPITVTVNAGETLYLPSLWFHSVTQTCETVAVNYWYDMNFQSPLFVYFKLLESARLLDTSTTDAGSPCPSARTSPVPTYESLVR